MFSFDLYETILENQEKINSFVAYKLAVKWDKVRTRYMCYDRLKLQHISREEIVKLTAFILLIIGTAGLLLNEFIFDWGRTVTIIFAVINFIGLVTLAFIAWGRKGAN